MGHLGCNLTYSRFTFGPVGRSSTCTPELMCFSHSLWYRERKNLCLLISDYVYLSVSASEGSFQSWKTVKSAVFPTLGKPKIKEVCC